MKKHVVTSVLLLGLTLLSAKAIAANPCGRTVTCQIEGVNGGTYYVASPANGSGNGEGVSADKPLKAFVFFHGHNGSGAAMMRNKGLSNALAEAGYLLVAPDGPQFTFNGRTTRGWAARPEGENPRGRRDDVKFVENVLADLSKRFELDPSKTVVSGFSSGGSMAWYFSCYSKAPLAGVVAVAGGLRRPLPENGQRQADGSLARTCPGGPRKLIHIHGFSDRQVPLEGRRIRSWHQGDVFEGLAVQRHTNQCQSRPDQISAKGTFWCRQWNRCRSQQPIQLCLHKGGHGMPKNWLQQVLNWLDDT
ncbi:MAG: alpha/beta fold hydrolase [Rhizobiaceae bacterium]